MTDKLNASGLKELFGRAILIRAITHGRLAKHSSGRKHFVADAEHLCLPHRPGTKFVRQCIRRSGRESHYNRELYALMTGHQYTGTSS